MSRPFLATGCGRSGTTWISHLLTRLGIPTWHERQFDPYHSGPLVVPEASWLAIPYIDTLHRDTPVLRMIRNPYDVISSVMQLDFQVGRVGNDHDAFLIKHGPSFITEPDDKLTRAIRWVTTWDYPLDDIDHHVIKTDVDTSVELVDAIVYVTGDDVRFDDVQWAMNRVGTKVNTKRRTHPVISHRDIDAHPEGWRVRRRAERFGYR